ncbi:diguanylate cyclase [Sulfurimonas sp.]|uniref:diguanylate cyclase n=1 Tax=Sulfurimonas sp. TaxID=2022749 RepID=UPI003D09AD7E
MHIFNNKKVYLLLIVFILIGISFSLYYFNYVSEKKNSMQMLNYERQAQSMQARIAQMIYEKQRATTAIGLVLVQDRDLINSLKYAKINDSFYKNLTKKLRENTEYKNIWVNIIDNKLTSVYRSWTDKKGDTLKGLREDVIEVIKTQKISYTISSGKYSVAIKALIPILEEDKIVGVLEIISHFNSIALSMKDMQIDSVVILNKEDSKKLQFAFTGNFLDGYYIANFDAPKDKLEYLQKKGIENYFNTGYKIENGCLITAFPLISFDGKVLGYYIMFKYLNNISSTDEDFFVFKLTAMGFIVIFVLAIIFNIGLVYILARQKSYIKNIIDSSTNIVIINDKRRILDVNRAFFTYFSKEKNLDEFQEKYQCVGDLFVEEEGYVPKYIDGEIWIDHLLRNPEENNKVKISYDGKLYYFTINVSLILPEKGYYSVVFSDITKEEMYKLELEKLTITDTLTGIGNRRFYNLKIEENISTAKRYKFPLSLIIMDIDYFKQVNDKYGHGVGDNVLVEYSQLISSMIRGADVFCRIGGEEFVLIVPHTDLKNATLFAEKIRKKVSEAKIVLPITFSFGVTEYILGEDADHILTRADEALYIAKQNGRDQVVSK